MDFEQLNIKAKAHLASPNDFTFSEMYREATKLFQRMNRVRITCNRVGDDNDADELLDKVIMKVIAKSPDNFGAEMLRSIRNAQLDFFKTERRRRTRYELTIDAGSPNSEVADGDDKYPIETEIINKQRKKEADQRQLIDFLSDPAQVDEDTTRIVSIFSEFPSIRALAKALGLHYEYVNRKLRKLSRRYDANRFGDLNDYLAS